MFITAIIQPASTKQKHFSPIKLSSECVYGQLFLWQQ